MSKLAGLLARLRLLVSRRRAEERMEEEFRFHVDMETASRIAGGLSPDAARREAVRAFGGLDRHREAMRDDRGGRWLEEMMADLRYALRMLRKSPSFAAIAILTLALGIGANTAMFSVVNAVLIRPLPVDDLERLVVIREDIPGIGLLNAQLAPIEVVELSERTDVFETVGGWVGTSAILTGESEATRLSAAATVGDFFGAFDLTPAAGRFYGAEASVAGAAPVAVVSHALWQQLSGGDPSLVGSRLRLDDTSYEVVGVMPADFRYPRDVQVWRPFVLTEQWLENRGSLAVTAVAVPRGGAELLSAHLGSIADGWNERYFAGGDFAKRLNATPFLEHLSGPLATVMLVLAGAVVLVLLIAVANVANLQLVRVTGRAKELAVRTALGASRRRVLAQLAVENLALAVAGGLAGVALGLLVLRGLERWSPASQMFLTGIPFEAKVFGLAAALALSAAVIFGTVPAMRGSRVEPQDALREAGRGQSHGASRNRLLKVSVAAQVALAMVLLVGSGLMVRTLAGLLGTDSGFRAEDVAVLEVAAPSLAYGTTERRGMLYRTLIERVRALPGVESAALMWGVPFSGTNDSSPFDIPGQPARPGEPERHAEGRYVSDGAFRTLGIPLLAGRDFAASDAGAASVAIIDETFAAQFFPGEDPLGRQIEHYVGRSTIIGIAARVDHDEIADAPKATAYYSTLQHPYVRNVSILVRSSLPTEAVVDMVRRAVREIDASVPLYDITTMEHLVARSLGPRRLALLALAGFAGLSLLLTTLGVYGVMRYTTQERTREIGVRMALGAGRGDVTGMVVRQGVVISLAGAALGVAGALALTRFMAGILFAVEPNDPLTFAGVAALLLCVTAAASWLPARRAARIEPLRALRE